MTLFPVITGQSGLDPIFQGAADFDLELIESRTLDGHIQELIYRPTLHAESHAHEQAYANGPLARMKGRPAGRGERYVQ